MNYGLLVIVTLAAAVTGICGINKAADHQQRALEANCHCVCVRVDDAARFPNPALGPDEAAPTPIFDSWLREVGSGRGYLTMAWGGGFWRCAR